MGSTNEIQWWNSMMTGPARSAVDVSRGGCCGGGGAPLDGSSSSGSSVEKPLQKMMTTLL